MTDQQAKLEWLVDALVDSMSGLDPVNPLAHKPETLEQYQERVAQWINGWRARIDHVRDGAP